MTAVLEVPVAQELTLADLVESLGPMPFSRIRTSPRPGTATEGDFLAIEKSEPLCELIEFWDNLPA